MRTILLVLISSLALAAQAHPGHDHSHWMSDPVHAITALALVSAAAATAFLFKRKLAQKK